MLLMNREYPLGCGRWEWVRRGVGEELGSSFPLLLLSVYGKAAHLLNSLVKGGLNFFVLCF